MTEYPITKMQSEVCMNLPQIVLNYILTGEVFFGMIFSLLRLAKDPVRPDPRWSLSDSG